MILRLALLLALLSPAAALAEAVAGPDMRYRYDAADHPLLKDYDGEPWWVMLANCAGYASAAAEQPGLPAQSVDGYRHDGNYYATLASYRYARDHQLAPGIRPEVVEIADGAADNALANGLLASVEQRRSMAVLCGAHVTAYERMVPGKGLQ